MKMVFVLLCLVLFLSACSSSNQVSVSDDSFIVDYLSIFSSSAGDRVINISYVVVDGVLVSCDGYYQGPGPHQVDSVSGERMQGDKVPCDVDLLRNSSSPFGVEVFTSLPSQHHVVSDDGRSYVEYRVSVAD